MSNESYSDRMAKAESRVGEKTTTHVGDYTIAMERTFSHAVAFKVYEILSRDLNDNILDWKIDGEPHVGAAERIEDASIFASGSVKWDGCINFSFDAQERGCLHLCGPRGAADLGTMLHGIFEIAAAMMPEVCDFADELNKARSTVRPPPT